MFFCHRQRKSKISKRDFPSAIVHVFVNNGWVDMSDSKTTQSASAMLFPTCIKKMHELSSLCCSLGLKTIVESCVLLLWILIFIMFAKKEGLVMMKKIFKMAITLTIIGIVALSALGLCQLHLPDWGYSVLLILLITSGIYTYRLARVSRKFTMWTCPKSKKKRGGCEPGSKAFHRIQSLASVRCPCTLVVIWSRTFVS